MKDADLDILLAEYRNKKPTDLQMQKWKRSIRKETSQSQKSKVWLQLIAASVVGFIIGALVVKNLKTEGHSALIAQNESDNATIEYVLTKTD